VSNIAIAILKERDFQLWYTSATPPEDASVDPSILLKIKGNHLIVFGTGWGLDHKNMSKLNGWLSPIEGVGKVRHLSVRAALVIYLDRLSKGNYSAPLGFCSLARRRMRRIRSIWFICEDSSIAATPLEGKRRGVLSSYK